MKFAVQDNLWLALAVTLMAGGLSLVSGVDVRPTVAPLTMSTVKPTMAPKIGAPKPTKPMMIINAPPVKQRHLVPVSVLTDDSEAMPMLEKMSQKMPEKMAAQMPVEQMEVKPMMKDAKPMQVTGFITKAGNIYEIEGKDGQGAMGAIEGRQAEQDGQIVCNYGNVVIYSDVPCDQVTNIKVGAVQQRPVQDQPISMPAEPQTEKPAAAVAEPEKPAEQQQEEDELSGAANMPRGQQQRPRRRRPQNQAQRRKQNMNRRRNGNANGNRKRNGVRNGNRNGIRNGNRNGVRRVQMKRGQRPGQRRGQAQRKPANRRQQQQQKRRRLQQQQKQRRRQQQKQQQRRTNLRVREGDIDYDQE